MKEASLFLLVVIMVSVAAYFKGKSDGASAVAPPDTVTVTHTVSIPSKPSIILKPVPVKYDTSYFTQRLEQITSKLDSVKNRADSLESLLTTYLEPFGGEVFDSLHTSTATLHYRAIGVAFPMDRSISIALDSISLRVPEVTITQTVQEPVPWYEKPLYILAGLGLGLLVAR